MSSVLWSRASISEGRSAPPAARHRCLVRLCRGWEGQGTHVGRGCWSGRKAAASVGHRKVVSVSVLSAGQSLLAPTPGSPRRGRTLALDDAMCGFLPATLLGSIVGELVMVPDEHVVTLTAVRHTLVRYDPMVPHCRGATCLTLQEVSRFSLVQFDSCLTRPSGRGSFLKRWVPFGDDPLRNWYGTKTTCVALPQGRRAHIDKCCRFVLQSRFFFLSLSLLLSCEPTLPGASRGTHCRGAGFVRLAAQRRVQDECLNESHLLCVSVLTVFL